MKDYETQISPKYLNVIAFSLFLFTPNTIFTRINGIHLSISKFSGPNVPYFTADPNVSGLQVPDPSVLGSNFPDPNV